MDVYRSFKTWPDSRFGFRVLIGSSGFDQVIGSARSIIFKKIKTISF
jgi:hypothetical protein